MCAKCLADSRELLEPGLKRLRVCRQIGTGPSKVALLQQNMLGNVQPAQKDSVFLANPLRMQHGISNQHPAYPILSIKGLPVGHGVQMACPRARMIPETESAPRQAQRELGVF